MSRIRTPIKVTVVMAVMVVFSCSKEPMGYLEVRNLTNETFNNVAWGEFIHLGTIAPWEEQGEETASFTSKYLYFEIGNGIFRSREEITVDANSSATFIVKDKNQLIMLE